STAYSIESVTFEVTQKLDVGAWKDPKFKGEKIPTLEDALKTIQKGSVTLLERKTGSALDHAKLLERMGLVEDLIVQSFDWDFLAAMRTWLPEAKLAALSGKEVTEEKLNDIQRLGIDIAVWRHSDLTPQNFPMFAKHGLEVWVYTVDEPADWKQMVDLGVTGLITDKPAELRKWLKENGYE
ncbi:MAG: glycerophosphodiester phosphodiesterase, partial [Candidatus Omnitrophica bacterium]|nr:glycerophosphodiester phosphodiesterase [Candidatus Omnitrophota bacterium]